MADVVETRDHFREHLTVAEHFHLGGNAKNGATVLPHVHFSLSGTVMGDLIVAENASAEIRGTVTGDLINRGVVSVYGTIRGSVRDEASGWSYIASCARVLGDARPKAQQLA